MIPALHDFNEYLYGDKADEKKDALHVSLLTKMQGYRPSGVSIISIQNSPLTPNYISIDITIFISK